MVTYKAAYYVNDEEVHVEVLDFPGVHSFGKDVREARDMVQSALVDMAEALVELGKPLPIPNPQATDPNADLEEPLHLLMRGASLVEIVPREVSA